MIPLKQVRRTLVASGALALVALVAVGLASLPASAAAPKAVGPAPATVLADLEACTLVEGVPAPGHPIRAAKSFAAIYRRLAAARTPKDYAKVHRLLRRVIDPLFATGTRVFHAKRFKRAAAERFLSRHVLRADAPLEVGEDRFELRLELAATVAFAACRAGDREAAIHVTRRASGPEKASLRAFGALLLLEAGRIEEAQALRPTLGEDTFLGAWVLAELQPAEAADERLRLHGVARRRIANPDQRTALTAQRRRHALGTR